MHFKSRECLQLLTQYCRSWEFILKNVKHYVVLQVIISYIAYVICKMEKKAQKPSGDPTLEEELTDYHEDFKDDKYENT